MSEPNLWQRLTGGLSRSIQGASGQANAERGLASVAIVTDSAASLPTEWLASAPRAGLSVVPMSLMVDGEIYQEGDEELLTHLSLALAAGKAVKTSRPSPGVLAAAYARAYEAGYSEVCSIHLASGLSGTVDAARLAAERAPLPVHVVDSAAVGMGQGLAVWAAFKQAEAGLQGAAIAAQVPREIARTATFFSVPSLDTLRRGGRISPAAGWLGGMLSIKPILSVRDGKIAPLENVRGGTRAMARLVQLVGEQIAQRSGDCAVVIHHFGNRDQAERLAGALRSGGVRPAQLLFSAVPAVLAAHVGLGVLGVVVAPLALAPAGSDVDADDDDGV